MSPLYELILSLHEFMLSLHHVMLSLHKVILYYMWSGVMLRHGLFTSAVRLCCRAHEQDLSKRHERDLGEMTVVHHRETQIMLADFNKAQEVLKDKISALQIL